MAKLRLTAQKGTTLSDLANIFGTSVEELKKINNLQNDVIQPGQVFEYETSDVDGVKQRLQNLQTKRQDKYNADKKKYDDYQAKLKDSQDSFKQIRGNQEDYGDLNEGHIKDYTLNKKEKGWKSVDDYKKYLANEHKSNASTIDLAQKAAMGIGAGMVAAPILANPAILASGVKAIPGLAKSAIINAPEMIAGSIVSDKTGELLDKHTDLAPTTKELLKFGTGSVVGGGGANVLKGVMGKGLTKLTNYGGPKLNSALDYILNKNSVTSGLTNAMGTLKTKSDYITNPIYHGLGATVSGAPILMAEKVADKYLPEDVVNNEIYQVGKFILPYLVGKSIQKATTYRAKQKSGGASNISDVLDNALKNKGQVYNGSYTTMPNANSSKPIGGSYNNRSNNRGYVDYEYDGKDIEGFTKLAPVRTGQRILINDNSSSDDVHRALSGKLGGNRYGKGQQMAIMRNNIQNNKISTNAQYMDNDNSIQSVFEKTNNGYKQVSNKVKNAVRGERNKDTNFPIKMDDKGRMVVSNNAGHNYLLMKDGEHINQFNIDTSGYQKTGSSYRDPLGMISGVAGKWLDHWGNHLYQTSVTRPTKIANSSSYVQANPRKKRIKKVPNFNLFNRSSWQINNRVNNLVSTLHNKKADARQSPKLINNIIKDAENRYNYVLRFNKAMNTNFQPSKVPSAGSFKYSDEAIEKLFNLQNLNQTNNYINKRGKVTREGLNKLLE